LYTFKANYIIVNYHSKYRQQYPPRLLTMRATVGHFYFQTEDAHFKQRLSPLYLILVMINRKKIVQ